MLKVSSLRLINILASYGISPYFIDSEGKAVPELPDDCPRCDGQQCTIVVHHLRERKTGPAFPLYVVLCKTHKIGFTLYPPGYYPYSRHTLAQLDSEGNQLTRSNDDFSLFAGTLFEAANDAAQGIPWPSESGENSLQARFPTQLRHLQRALVLLGIASGTEPFLREERAQLLGVQGQILSDSAREINLPACGYQRQGMTICAILQHIPAETMFERLAEAGASAGLWPSPLVLNNNLLQPSSFRRVRTRASP